MRERLKQIALIGIGTTLGILLSLNFSAVANKDSGPLPIEELRAFTEVFGRIKSDYVEPVEDKKLITEAITGMLNGLDPHSSYLDADSFKELQIGTQGEFGGLGIEVGMEDGFIKVVSPIEDTPAFHAGLKSGDLVIKIDDASVKGMSLNEAVKRMRGKPNTKVTLTVLRKSDAKPKPLIFNLTRAVIKVQSVKSKLIEPGFGYIRITQFQERTGEDLVKALENFYKPELLKGLVLDLRNDPGGLLNGAVAVSSAFLPPEVLVVYIDGRTEDSKKKFHASSEDYLHGQSKDDYLKNLPKGVKNVPMVVLINGGSASASEIVAGALQDHKRATIMGTQSFGKASVQTILPLSNNTAIKLTTARYYTPNGHSIQAKGISPDIIIEDETSANDSGFKVREADLERHLMDGETKAKAGEGNKVKSKTEPKKTQKIITRPPRPKTDEKDKDKDKAEAPMEFGSKDDFQLTQAINFLKGIPLPEKISEKSEK